MILANAYGDTVWFESDSIPAGRSPYGWGDTAPFEPTAAVPLCFTIEARTSSKGLVLLVASEATLRPPAAALIERLASKGLGRSTVSLFPYPRPDQYPLVYEPGCFSKPMRWPCGWSFHPKVEARAPVRMTFVVVGRPVGGSDARRGRDGAPAPIEPVAGLRPFDLSGAEVRATARLVGDVIADFNRRVMLPLQAGGTRVVTRATPPW